MEREERRTRFQDVRHPRTRRLLFRFDASRDIIQATDPKEKKPAAPVLVDLNELRRRGHERS